jgi:heat shock protein HslJ
MRLLALSLLSLIPACQPDETVRAYGAADRVWTLTEIDDQAFEATATLQLSDEGTVSGRGPCNSYSASMTVPYPWFEVGPIRSTKSACPELGQEALFFVTLKAMSLSEVLGDILILSTPEGRKMVFTTGG